MVNEMSGGDRRNGWRDSGMIISLLRMVIVLGASEIVTGGGRSVFIVRPESVLVAVGNDLLLQCVVDLQHASVQWAKNGFALGYDRSVPGYPRYQYIGDTTQGQTHLAISGVTLQDDGEFECWASTNLYTSHPAKASANVTVLVAPSSIRVSGGDEGGSVEAKEGREVVLECIVGGGRPPPSVAWYRNGIKFPPDKHQEEEVASEEGKVWDVKSRLVFVAKADDHNQLYSCRAFHPALKHSPTTLVASTTLHVLHAPKPPLISGYVTGEALKEGERRALICLVVGGNPRPWVTWYRHGRPLTPSSMHHNPSLTPLPVKKATGETVKVEQRIIGSREENAAVYECRVTSTMLKSSLTANVTLTVHYAPTRVDISGDTMVVAGEQLDLTCTSSPANPAPTISWTMQGKDVDVGKSVSIVEQDESGGWQSKSILSQLIPATLNLTQVQIKCKAGHPALHEPLTADWTLRVVKRPGDPVLVSERLWDNTEGGLVGHGGSEVVSGSLMVFVCTTQGGRPPPQVTLDKDGVKLPSVITGNGEVIVAKSEVQVEAGDNGAVVKCNVESPATPTPLTATYTIHLSFPASDVQAWISPEVVEEGHTATLICQTSSSRPPALITWHSEGFPLNDATTTHTQAPFGGTHTRSVVKLRVERVDSGRVFSCHAHNGLGITVSTNITLDVVYGPEWVEPPSSELEVEEGEDLVIVVEADGNPSPLTYKWWRGPHRMEGIDPEGSKAGKLHLRRLHRQDAGDYSVTAINTRASINASFNINVLYAPEGMVSPTRVTLDQGSPASVMCSAVGNPTPTLTWTKGSLINRSSDESEGRKWIGEGEVRLELPKAELTDTGFYHCQARNVVAAAPPSTTAIVVAQTPRPLVTPESGLSGRWWARVGGSGRLKCRVVAAPAPTFKWIVNSTRVILNSHKYFVRLPQLVDGLVEWVSVLEVKNVEPSDYTEYTCSATNTQGSLITNQTLSPPRPPLPPVNLKVADVKVNSVTLAWRSEGNNGTKAEGFNLRYRTAGDSQYQEMEVLGGNNSRLMVDGLTSGMEYYFSIQSFNHQGTSPYTSPALVVKLPEKMGMSSNGDVEDNDSRLPRLLVLLLSLTAAAFLVLNVTIIIFFVRRCKNRRAKGLAGKMKGVGQDEGCSTGSFELDISRSSRSLDSVPSDVQVMCLKSLNSPDFKKEMSTEKSQMSPLMDYFVSLDPQKRSASQHSINHNHSPIPTSTTKTQSYNTLPSDLRKKPVDFTYLGSSPPYQPKSIAQSVSISRSISPLSEPEKECNVHPTTPRSNSGLWYDFKSAPKSNARQKRSKRDHDSRRQYKLHKGTELDDLNSDDCTSDSSTESVKNERDCSRVHGKTNLNSNITSNIPDVCLKSPRSSETKRNWREKQHPIDEDRLSVSSHQSNDSQEQTDTGTPELPPRITHQAGQYREHSANLSSVDDSVIQSSHVLPAKPTSQVIYHGQPHLQMQLEKEQEELKRKEAQEKFQRQLQKLQEETVTHPYEYQEKDHGHTTDQVLRQEIDPDLPHLSYKHSLTSIHEEPTEHSPKTKTKQWHNTQHYTHHPQTSSSSSYHHHQPSPQTHTSHHKFPQPQVDQYRLQDSHYHLTDSHHVKDSHQRLEFLPDSSHHLPEKGYRLQEPHHLSERLSELGHHHLQTPHHHSDRLSEKGHHHLQTPHHHSDRLSEKGHHHLQTPHHLSDRLSEKGHHHLQTPHHLSDRLSEKEHHHFQESHHFSDTHQLLQVKQREQDLTSSYPLSTQRLPCCEEGAPCNCRVPRYPTDPTYDYCKYCVTSTPCCDELCRRSVLQKME